MGAIGMKALEDIIAAYPGNKRRLLSELIIELQKFADECGVSLHFVVEDAEHEILDEATG